MPDRDHRILVTDAPDPTCVRCRGKGVIGGCRDEQRCRRENHMHTISFCECVNERYEDAMRVALNRDLTKEDGEHPVNVALIPV